MGLFSAVFGNTKPKKKMVGPWQTMTAYRPTFYSTGAELYEQEQLRAAINAVATHISKLKFEMQGEAQPTTRTRLTKEPNPWMTWSQYLYRLATILYVQNTAFIVPIRDEYGRTAGLFPVLPSRCELVKDELGKPYIRYYFASGETGAIELALCGIMTRFQYSDDIMGESNEALRPTMELISIQNQAIAEGMKSAASYKFMAHYADVVFDNDLEEAQKNFNRRNFGMEAEGGGTIVFPKEFENPMRIETKPFVMDADQMKAIDTHVYNYTGTNEDVLQNKAIGDKWSAFYEGPIEAFAIQASDVHTRMIYSPLERGYGNTVMFTANRLQYMTNKEKLEFVAQMGDRGMMTRNELREVLNLPPLPEPYGSQIPTRGEYYAINDESGGDEKNA